MEAKISSKQIDSLQDSPSTKMYDLLASSYREVSKSRQTWIASINNFIAEKLRPGNAILDVGAGDGVRARNIADAVGIKDITLIEPSVEMSKLATNVKNSQVFSIAAENMSDIELPQKYDAVLCLWNVLGHVPSFEKRVLALKNMKAVLQEGGHIFLDVNNRYNIRAYDDIAIKNIETDQENPEGKTGENGDVNYEMVVGDKNIPASGHVFTQEEISLIAKEAGVTITDFFYFDYDTGELVDNQFEGQILAVIR